VAVDATAKGEKKGGRDTDKTGTKTKRSARMHALKFAAYDPAYSK